MEEKTDTRALRHLREVEDELIDLIEDNKEHSFSSCPSAESLEDFLWATRYAIALEFKKLKEDWAD